MILDETLEFASATSVGTPNDTTVNCGDVIDLGATPGQPGLTEPMALVVQVTTAVTSGGSATVRFKAASDATSTPSVDGTASEHGSTDDIPVASLVAGASYVIPLGTGVAYERYLGFQITETAGQALTAGAVDAFLVPISHVSKWTSYPDASN